jgi:hypothetical protein
MATYTYRPGGPSIEYIQLSLSDFLYLAVTITKSLSFIGKIPKLTKDKVFPD